MRIEDSHVARLLLERGKFVFPNPFPFVEEMSDIIRPARQEPWEIFLTIFLRDLLLGQGSEPFIFLSEELRFKHIFVP